MAPNKSFLPQSRDFPYTNDADAVQPPLSSPPLSSPGTLARFEFEAGKGNEGTKVLLVEWPSSTSSAASSQFDVTWGSMPATVLSVDDSPTHPAIKASGGDTRRQLFLLPPYAPIPRLVHITTGDEMFQTNPLPAIFPAGSPDNGRKGVLHTAFARGRLRDLEDEIEREAATNAESVALEMALQEKNWLEQEYFYADTSGFTADPAPFRLQGASTISTEAVTRTQDEVSVDDGLGKRQTLATDDEEGESDNELFAVTMSPRAPDAVMSPYAVRTPDYVPWR